MECKWIDKVNIPKFKERSLKMTQCVHCIAVTEVRIDNATEFIHKYTEIKIGFIILLLSAYEHYLFFVIVKRLGHFANWTVCESDFMRIERSENTMFCI